MNVVHPLDQLNQAKAIGWFIRECLAQDVPIGSEFSLSGEGQHGLCCILDLQHELLEAAMGKFEDARKIAQMK